MPLIKMPGPEQIPIILIFKRAGHVTSLLNSSVYFLKEENLKTNESHNF